MQKEFTIGSVKPKNRLILAPLAGVSDLPFRLLCREQGAGLAFTEMINSEAVSRNNKSALRIAQSCEKDRPLGLQLFGAKVSSMKDAAAKLCKEAEFDFLDLNLGCPDGKILKQGAGAALLKRAQRAQELIEVMKETGMPVSAKIRLNPNVLHSIKFCKALEKAGVEFITVHGRTVRQKYSGKVDFVAIKRIAKAVSVPVVANGNIKTTEDVETTLRDTGCVATMIGRAAIGNPGVFAELQGKKGPEPMKMLLKYLELHKEFNPGNFGKKKTQVIRFLAKAKQYEITQKVQKAKTEPELEKALDGV